MPMPPALSSGLLPASALAFFRPDDDLLVLLVLIVGAMGTAVTLSVASPLMILSSFSSSLSLVWGLALVPVSVLVLLLAVASASATVLASASVLVLVIFSSGSPSAE